MRKSVTLFLFITLIVFLNSLPANAQFRNLFRDDKIAYSTIGFGGGSSHYFGDLAPYSYFYYGIYSNVRWNGTINYQRHFTNKFSARASFSYVRIFGNDETWGGTNAGQKGTNRLRNLHFRNDLMEFAIMGIYAFRPMNDFSNIRNGIKFSPYIGAGIGIVGHDPKARGNVYDASDTSTPYAGKVRAWESLKDKNTGGQEDGTVKAYSSLVPVFPIVLGVKYKLNPKWILSAEVGLRISMSDYLDDVGPTPYSASSEFSYRADENYGAFTGNDRTDVFRQELVLRGHDPTDKFPVNYAEYVVDQTKLRGSKGALKDSYITTQITLNYIISKQIKCPPIK